MLLDASLDSVSVCLPSFEVSRRSAPALDPRSVRAPVLSPLPSVFLHAARGGAGLWSKDWLLGDGDHWPS
jgi:hypothetical protein